MRFWRYYKVMKYIWFINKDNDIYKITEDYSYVKIYFKNGNYTKNYLGKTTKKDFTTCKRIYKLKEISESDAILELL